MRLTEKEKGDIMAALDDDLDLDRFMDERGIKWRPVLQHAAFWLLIIAIPLVILAVLPNRQ